MLSELRQRKLTAWFGVVDRDDDGAVARNDFEQQTDLNARSLGLKPQAPEYQKMLSGNMMYWDGLREICDVDDDGRVTLDEWLGGMERFLSEKQAEVESFQSFLAANIIKNVDKDGDGKISKDEYVAVGSRSVERSIVEHAFEQFDVDGSGYLTQEELQRHFIDFVYGEDPQTPGNNLLGPLR